MNIRLSYYGWMVTRNLVKVNQLHLGDSPKTDLLLDLYTGLFAPYEDSSLHNFMLDEGLIELSDRVCQSRGNTAALSTQPVRTS